MRATEFVRVFFAFALLFVWSHVADANSSNKGNAFTSKPLAFYADKTSNIAVNDVVRWHLDIPYKQGSPITCTVKWVIPSGWSVLTSSVNGIAHGGSQNWAQVGADWIWTIYHYHQQSSSFTVDLRWDGPGSPTPPTVTEQSCGGYAGGGSTIAVTTPQGIPVGSGNANYLTPAAAPNLTLSKAVSSISGLAVPSHVQNGETVTYEIVVRNEGDLDDTNVLVCDAVPANATFVSHSGAGAGAAPANCGGDPGWVIGTLPAKSSQTLQFIVRASGLNGDPITNTARATHDNFLTQVTATATTLTIDAVPSLDIRKNVDKPHAAAGDLVTYTLLYSNTGSAAATNVEIIDSLPAGMTFDSAIPAPTSVAGNTLTWQFTPDLGYGQQVEYIVIRARVPATANINDTFTNNATINATNAALVTSNDAVIDVQAAVPVMSLSKSFTPSVTTAGGVVSVSLDCSNIGGAAASQTILRDELPAGLTVESAQGGTVTNGGRTVEWNIGTVAANAPCSRTFTARVDPGLGDSQLVNNAFLEAVNAFNTPVSAQAILTVNAAAVLTLSKQVDRAVADDNDTLTYTLTFQNIGSADTSGLTLIDGLSDYVDPASLTGTGFSESGGVLTWSSLAELKPGQTSSVTFSVDVDAGVLDYGKEIINIALIFDATSAALAGARTVIEQLPSLEITKTPDKPVFTAGLEGSYTISYRNVGNAQATGVVIEDALPQYMTPVQTKLPANATWDAGTRTISWTIGNLPVSNTFQQIDVPVLVSASAPAPISVLNHASILSNERPAVTTEVPVTIGASLLELTKTASSAQVNAGDTMTYTFTVKNTGSAASGAVTVTDTLPSEMTPGTSSLAYTVDAGNPQIISWNLAKGIPAGRSSSFTLDVTIASPLADGTQLNNSATATWPTGTVNLTNPGQGTITVSSHPQLVIDKQIDNANPSPGQLVTYTIQYDNVGNAVASDVYLQDVFPVSVLDFVSTSAGNYTPDGSGVMTIQLGSLNTNSPGTLTVTGKVKAAAPDQASFTNAATIGRTVNLLDPATDSATGVVSSSALSITKRTLTPNPRAGDTVRYIISVSNSGTAASGALTVTDQRSPELSFISATPAPTQTAGGLAWNIGSVAPGDQYDIDVTMQVASPLTDQTVIANRATLTGTGISFVTRPVLSTVSSAPILEITKVADVSRVEPGPGACAPVSGPACLGGTVGYTITVTNVGTDTATNVVVSDALSGKLEPVLGGTGSPSLSGGVLQWPAISLVAGQSHVYHLSARAHGADAVADGEKLLNTATVTSSQTSAVSAQASVTADGTPALTISKTSSAGGHIGLDQPITWTISYTNTGTAAASNVQVVDVLPLISPTANAQIRNVSWSRTPDVLTGNIAEWNIGTLAAGASGSLTINAIVLDPGGSVADGTPLGNAAAIGAFTDNTYTTLTVPPALDVAIDRITSKPVLSISKSTSTVHAQPGDEVAYTITYANTGTDTATNVTITDNLDPNLVFDHADGSPKVVGQTVTWTLPSLAAHDSGSLTLVARVRSPIANGTLIGNSVSIDSTQTTPVTNPGTGPGLTIESHPALSLTKTPNLPLVKAGGTLTYQLVYENTGNDTAHSVILEDLLPSYLKFVSATPSSGGAADSSNTVPAGGGYVTWDLGDIKVGQKGSISVTADVVSPIADGTKLLNGAFLVSPDDASIAISSTPVSSSPALQVTKRPDRPVVVDGDQLTYHIDFSNIGTDTATAITLTDTLPAYTTFVSADHNGSEAGGVVTWNGADLTPSGDLDANDSGSVSVTVQVNLAGTVPNGTRIANTATFTATNAPDATTSNTVVIDSRPLLQLTDKVVSPQKFAAPNQQILYRLSYTNVGTDVATDVVLTDRFPSGAIPIAVTNSGSFNTNTNTVMWHLSRLAPGQTIEVEYTLQVPAGTANGTQWNTYSSLTASNAQPVASSTRLRIASEPDVIVSKVGSTSVQDGNQATYRIDYQNVGSATATNVVIADTLPAGWTLDVGASTAGATGTTGTVTWNVGDVPPTGSGGSITVVANVPVALADGSAWTNTGSVTGTNVVPASSGQTTVIRSNPVLAVAITGAPDPVSAGGQVLFQVSYKNTGDADALVTELVATIPPNTTYVPGSAPGAVYDGVAQTLTWSLGTVGPYPPLAPMDSFTFLVDVASPIADHTALTSRATIAANNAATQTASATVYVSSQPLLLTSKTVTPQQVQTGQTVTYTMKMQNIGTDDAVNITVSDTLPSSLRLLSADNGGTVDSSTNTVSWTVASLSPGDPELVFNASARVIEGGVIDNVALISGTNTGGGTNHVTSPASQLFSTFVPANIPTMGELQRWLLVVLMMIAAYGAHYRLARQRKSL